MRPTVTLCLLLLVSPVAADALETLSCPELATAVQVGNCPGEEELKYTFNGFCSDNRRMYQQDAAVCTDYQAYRQLKNVAQWESADGNFAAYLSCDLPPATLKAARVTRIEARRQGKIGLLTCHYGEDISFTYRSRLQCTVDGSGDCAGNPAACKASCE